MKYNLAVQVIIFKKIPIVMCYNLYVVCLYMCIMHKY